MSVLNRRGNSVIRMTDWKGSHGGPEEIDEEVCVETNFAGDLGICH